MFTRWATLFGLELELLRRDLVATLLGIVVPTAVTLVWISAVKTRSEEVPVAFCFLAREGTGAREDPAFRKELRDRLRAVPAIGEIHEVEDPSQIEQLFRTNRISVGIEVQPPAQETASDDNIRRHETFVLLGDGTSASTVLQELPQLAAELRDRLALLEPSSARRARKPAAVHVRYNPHRRPVYFLLPGLSVLLSDWVATVLAALSFVRERTGPLALYLRSLPVRPIELLLAKITLPILLGLLNLILTLSIGSHCFGADLGSAARLLAFLSFSLPSVAGSALLGAVLIWAARTPIGSALVLGFTLSCGFFLTGWWYPLYELPWPLRALSSLLPMTHHISLARSFLFKGAGQDEVAPCAAASVALCALFLAAAWLAGRNAAGKGNSARSQPERQIKEEAVKSEKEPGGGEASGSATRRRQADS